MNPVCCLVCPQAECLELTKAAESLERRKAGAEETARSLQRANGALNDRVSELEAQGRRLQDQLDETRRRTETERKARPGGWEHRLLARPPSHVSALLGTRRGGHQGPGSSSSHSIRNTRTPRASSSLGLPRSSLARPSCGPSWQPGRSSRCNGSRSTWHRLR